MVLSFVFITPGAQFGTAATMIMSGYLIHGNVWGGWPAVFYVIGGLTILWFILWSFFVFDSPADHPRISVEELNFIEKSIGNQSSKVMVLNAHLVTQFLDWKDSLVFCL
jgi:ACS family sodium-dependent inorganic phosphate cotransporter